MKADINFCLRQGLYVFTPVCWLVGFCAGLFKNKGTDSPPIWMDKQEMGQGRAHLILSAHPDNGADPGIHNFLKSFSTEYFQQCLTRI